MNILRHAPKLTISTLSCCFAALLAMACARTALADDWMTWASTYTHDPATGHRVDQYALAKQPYGPDRSAVQRSGYRHYRSSLQVGQTADNIHIVEQWGQQVTPYEQWRFPYRPYGVPYDAWGPQAPYGIFNGSFGNGYGRPTPGVGFPPGNTLPGNTLPGNMPPGNVLPSPYGYDPGVGGYGPSRGFPLQPEYRNQPWFDGTYPDAAPLNDQNDRQFFGR